ncbi:hypothetical protein ABXI76_29965 [Streptomyces parvus]
MKAVMVMFDSLNRQRPTPFAGSSPASSTPSCPRSGATPPSSRSPPSPATPGRAQLTAVADELARLFPVPDDHPSNDGEPSR